MLVVVVRLRTIFNCGIATKLCGTTRVELKSVGCGLFTVDFARTMIGWHEPAMRQLALPLVAVLKFILRFESLSSLIAIHNVVYFFLLLLRRTKFEKPGHFDAALSTRVVVHFPKRLLRFYVCGRALL